MGDLNLVIESLRRTFELKLFQSEEATFQKFEKKLLESKHEIINEIIEKFQERFSALEISKEETQASIQSDEINTVKIDKSLI
ncbi:hypothetical protein CANARDRAFT_26530, partial [[Candida] arabinofermentans NRRL YB-2248]